MALGTAAAISLAGVAVSAGSAGLSFAQASKQDKRAKQAQQDAIKAMNEARKMYDVNYMESLALQKEPYELEKEALLSQGAMAIQAGAESERGAAATAGRVQLAQNEAMAGQRTAMGKELSTLEKETAQEESRLRDIQANLSVGEAVGQQQIAADAEKARAAAIQSGMASATSAIQQGLQTIPLYQQDLGAQKEALSKMSMSTEDFQKFGNVKGKTMGAAGTDGFTNLDLEAIGNMSNAQFRQFKRDLTPTQRSMLFNNPQYLDSYNPFDYYAKK